jgi:hypothetical protein
VAFSEALYYELGPRGFVVTPPLYRFGLIQVTKRTLRPTRVGER